MQKEKDLGVKGNIKSKQKSEQYINRYITIKRIHSRHLEQHGRTKPSVSLSKEKVWRGQCTAIWNTFTVLQALPVPSYNTLGNILPIESVSKINFNHQRKSCNPELPAKAVPSACLCSWISVVRSNWQCLREETKNKWQMLLCSNGRISKTQQREDAVSKGLLWLWCLQNLPHLTITSSWLTWETLWGDTDFSSSLGCKLKLHHIKQRKCSFNEEEKIITSTVRGPPWYVILQPLKSVQSCTSFWLKYSQTSLQFYAAS